MCALETKDWGRWAEPRLRRNIEDGEDSMEIRTEQEGDVLVALTEDRVDGANAREFQDAVEAAIAGQDCPVVLDMERLVYMSSAGMRVILIIARSLQGENRKFAVCSLVGPVREVFEISGFDKIIQTHDTQAKAVAAVGG